MAPWNMKVEIEQWLDTDKDFKKRGFAFQFKSKTWWQQPFAGDLSYMDEKENELERKNELKWKY